MLTFGRTAALLLAIAVPATAQAQSAGKGFLFGTPAGSVTIRGGWAGVRAGSDLYRFTTDNLTLDRGDFSSPQGGIDFDTRLRGRTHVVLSTELSGVFRKSEFRHFIDNSGKPIEQSTSFRRVPIVLSVKQYLTGEGRSIGKFAWIPSRASTYVGAGVGGQYYRFKQTGDFIDFNTMAVFHDTFTSEGWARVAQAFGGLDYTLSPRFAVTSEARYAWSRGELSRDFAGFDRIDLSGFSTSIGLTIRY